MTKDVWEILQSQFEKAHSLNIPLNGGDPLQESSAIKHFHHLPSGNGKSEQYFIHQNGNGNKKQPHLITNGGGQGNGQNTNNLANGNKTVMDINGMRLFINIVSIRACILYLCEY